METKTAKITNVSDNGSWAGANGTLYKFNVALDNGDTGGVMTKEQAQTRYVKGETITYTIEEKNGFKNIKRVEEKTGFKPGGGGRQWNPVADEKRNATIVLQSCLDRAIQFHHLNGYSPKATDLGTKLKETFSTTEWFAKKILNSSLLVQPAQGENGAITKEIDNMAKQPPVEQPKPPAAPVTPTDDLPF